MIIKIDPSVEKFILSLGMPTAAKTSRTIELLGEFGHRFGMPHSKSIGKGLFELRIRGRQEIRIFYCFHKGTAYLLHGFIKKLQETPRKELKTVLTKLHHLT